MIKKFNYFYTKDNTLIRYTYIPANTSFASGKNIIFLQGRSSFIENYVIPITNLINQGHNVWMMDWRGQGGSERATKHPQKNHVYDFNLLLNDLSEFITICKKHGADNLILYGTSLGAHIGFRYLQEIKDHHVKKAIFLAPLFDIKLGILHKLIAKPIIGLISKFKLEQTVFGELYVPGYGNQKLNAKSKNSRRHEEYHETCQKNKHLLTGGPTLAWAKAMFESINKLKTKPLELNLPIAIYLGGKDNIVDNEFSKTIFKAQNKENKTIKSCLKTFPKASHNILLDFGEASLDKFWQEVQIFINN